MRIVIEEGLAIVFSEIENIAKKSRARYVAILKAVASGHRGWGDMKAFVEMRTGLIPDSRFSNFLEELVKYGYVKKFNGEHTIEDPIARYAILNKL